MSLQILYLEFYIIFVSNRISQVHSQIIHKAALWPHILFLRITSEGGGNVTLSKIT